MFKLLTESSLQQFFNEIYHILRETDTNLTEVWCELSKLSHLLKLNNSEIKEFFSNFNFISLKKGNYINYIVINKILFIIESINFLRLDIKKVSEIIDYNGFEVLIKEILSAHNYYCIKNFRFSDNSNLKTKTSQKRYEVDIIALYLKYILFIDAKQWRRRDSYRSLSKAANLQCRRARVLKNNPEVLGDLIQKLLGKGLNFKVKLPLLIIPIMITLEDNSIKINESQIPLVSIYELNSFIHELHDNLEYFEVIKIDDLNMEKTLF